MEELTPWSCAEARASMRGERGIGMRRGGGRREEKEGPRETRRGEEVEPAGPVEVFVTTYVRLTS